MRVLVAIDLNDADLAEAYGDDPVTTPVLDGSGWDELCASLDARAAEFYCGRNNHPVRGHVIAVGNLSGDGAVEALLDAAEVGAQGIEPDDLRYHVEGSLVTFRQHFEAQTEASA